MSNAPSAVWFLLDARDNQEVAWLTEWLADADWQPMLPDGLQGTALTRRMVRLSEDLDIDSAPERVWLLPVRIVWLPSPKKGVSGLVQDIFHGRVIAPGWFRRRWIKRFRSERVKPVMGDGAWLQDLSAAHQRHPSATARGTLASYIHARAMLVLERAERLARGPRYKFPRLLVSDFFGSAHYARRLNAISHDDGLSPTIVHQRALRYLHEMAASQNPFTLDLIITLYRIAVKARHDQGIDAAPDQLQALATRMRHEPVVFVISHKSMLDTVAFSLQLYDSNLPIPLTFGGINLRTFGIGALARRAGIIFLRRRFQDNPIYKATFRRYIEYLIDKRFSLMWALEGTRSRTGKLLPPRFGMFRYVIDSLDDQRAKRLKFIPVSVVYDQITEVRDYAIEQSGRSKRPEGMTWMVRFLRRGRPRGRVLIRLGQAVSVADVAPRPVVPSRTDESDHDNGDVVPDLAYRLAQEMNQATPITPIAVICLVLLAAGNRALKHDEIHRSVRAARVTIKRRGLELVGQADFKDPRDLDFHLERLISTDVVVRHDEGLEPLYEVRDGHHHEAAYYRNTAVHFFILDAIIELSLFRSIGVARENRQQHFFADAWALRHIFRREFYLPRGDDFERQIRTIMKRRFGSIESVCVEEPKSILARLYRSHPLVAHGVLRSFVDAYEVVLTEWCARPVPPVDKERPAFIEHCLRSARQRVLERRLFAVESVSKVLYESALEWIEHELAAAPGKQSLSTATALLPEVRQALDQLRLLSEHGPDAPEHQHAATWRPELYVE